MSEKYLPMCKKLISIVCVFAWEMSKKFSGKKLIVKKITFQTFLSLMNYKQMLLTIRDKTNEREKKCFSLKYGRNLILLVLYREATCVSRLYFLTFAFFHVSFLSQYFLFFTENRNRRCLLQAWTWSFASKRTSLGSN